MPLIQRIKKIAKMLTKAPTKAPTEMPTEAPTEVPTEAPTEVPTNNFNMEAIKLSDDVSDQIKGFNHLLLKPEQELLIDKLILNEEVKHHYKKNGLCKKCK